MHYDVRLTFRFLFYYYFDFILTISLLISSLSSIKTHKHTPTAKRPPVEETANFLQTLLANHGPNYLEKLFGSKARDALAPLGGVQNVAVALSGKSRDASSLTFL